MQEMEEKWEIVILSLIAAIFLAGGSAILNFPQSVKPSFIQDTVAWTGTPRIVKDPTLGDNISIVTANDQAENGLNIAMADQRIHQIINDVKDRYVDIYAKYPLEKWEKVCTSAFLSYCFSEAYKFEYRYGLAEISIEAKWSIIDGQSYPTRTHLGWIYSPADDMTKARVSEFHDLWWTIAVDLESKKVTLICNSLVNDISCDKSHNNQD